jgi:transposase
LLAREHVSHGLDPGRAAAHRAARRRIGLRATQVQGRTAHRPGAEVHLAHPLGVKAFSYRRVKNDERDAADLADLLRMGRLPEAWIAPAEVWELRELTRYRQKLVSLRTSCKD